MSSPLPKSIALALLVALGPALPGFARAEPSPSSSSDDAAGARIAELNEAGSKAYVERRYRAAIEKFVEAYAIDHDPNLLFNIARSYEKLGELGAAIEKYQAFIAAPGADTEGRLKAKASISELDALEAQGGTSQGAPVDGAPAPAPQPQAGSSPPKLWAWLSLGTGVVMTGVGATFYALGVRDHEQVTSAAAYDKPSAVHPLTHSEAQAFVDSGSTKKVVGGLGLGVGGALLATSALLFLSGQGASSAQPEHASLRVSPGPGRLFAAYWGSF